MATSDKPSSSVRSRCLRAAHVLKLLFALTFVAYILGYCLGCFSQAALNEKVRLGKENIASLIEEKTKCEAWLKNLANYTAKNGQNKTDKLVLRQHSFKLVDDIQRLRVSLYDCQHAVRLFQFERFRIFRDELSAVVEEMFIRENMLKASLALAKQFVGKARCITRSQLLMMSRALQMELNSMVKSCGVPEGNRSRCNNITNRYSVVFDIGSTGNRVHVYNFSVAFPDAALPAAPRDTLSNLKLHGELFEINHDALSEIEDPALAVKALQPLFAKAVEFVPQSHQYCVPIDLMATSGLRARGVENAQEILEHLSRAFSVPFWQKSAHPSRILEGSEEGPFAWLAVNFMLGHLEVKKESSSVSTAGIIDLGGGSSQIVFQPTVEHVDIPEPHRYKLTTGGRTIVAYHHSYEGLGLHAATGELLNAVQANNDINMKEVTVNGNRHIVLAAANFSCFARGYEDVSGVKRKIAEAHENDAHVHGGPSADFDSCVDLFVTRVLQEGQDGCSVQPCGMHGVHQPRLADIFHGPMYAFSFIYDLLSGYLAGGSEEIEIGRIADIGRERCTELTLETVSVKDPLHENQPTLKPEYTCMYYSYIYALLHHGYGLPNTSTVHIVKKIGGHEVSWALGAALQGLMS